jgi:cytochrome b-561
MFGALFLLSAFVPVHPLAAYGPPTSSTPVVKPDWYLLWIYGFLKIVPSSASFSLFGATIGPDFLGGLLFPALLFGLMTFTPWIDRTNRRATRFFQYLEPPRQSPLRFALGFVVIAFLLMLYVAAYYDTLGLSLGAMWLLALVVPVITGFATYIIMNWRQARAPKRFDPEGEADPFCRIAD